jgi:hypothetical protein
MRLSKIYSLIHLVPSSLQYSNKQWSAELPVVNLHWLEKMAESRELPGLDGFLVHIPACEVQAPPEAVDCMVVDEENGKDKIDLKGKGRAIERVKDVQEINAWRVTLLEIK